MQPDARTDPEQALERNADEFQEELDKLSGHIDEAKGKAAARAREVSGEADAFTSDGAEDEEDG